MSFVRTYNPSVRVGNWNEDIQLEEDSLKDFLARRERGELLIQQSASMMGSALKECSLSVSRDGNVHFGDIVMLVNPSPTDASRGASALSLMGLPNGSVGASATCNVTPSQRTAFVITSKDGSANGEPLRYGEAFDIANVDGNLFLQSDRATFGNCAKKSRHNPVSLVPASSHLTSWQILPFDPQIRMELEFAPVPANTKIILRHQKTNNALCNETDYFLKSPFGKEFEVSTFTSLDSHKAEKDCNHWLVSVQAPGDGSMGSIGPE